MIIENIGIEVFLKTQLLDPRFNSLNYHIPFICQVTQSLFSQSFY